jgi:hypothetical protein
VCNLHLRIVTVKQYYVVMKLLTVNVANHEATDGEAMRSLGVKDVNCYRPERTRLFQDGYLKCVGKRVCTVSGRTCKVWTAK